MIKTVLGWIRRVEAAMAVLLLAVLVAVVFAGTVMRYLGAPLIWSEELAQTLFVWLAMLATDLTLQRAGHFRIDMLTELLPGPLNALLDIIVKLMIAALLIALVRYGVDLIRVSHPRPLPMMDIPSSIAAAALPAAFLLMLLTTLEQIAGQLRGDRAAHVDAREVM